MWSFVQMTCGDNGECSNSKIKKVNTNQGQSKHGRLQKLEEGLGAVEEWVFSADRSHPPREYIHCICLVLFVVIGKIGKSVDNSVINYGLTIYSKNVSQCLTYKTEKNAIHGRNVLKKTHSVLTHYSIIKDINICQINLNKLIYKKLQNKN